jgi:geranylgeranyl reductase family protein
MSVYDVIVIGAGPAGSAAAVTAAGGGARTLLIDKARFPRYKTCGGGIDGVTAQAIQDLGVDFEDAVEDRTREVVVSYCGRGPTTYRLDRPIAWMTMRTDLDALLARAAVQRGAEFHDGEAIQEIQADRDGVRVQTDRGGYRARVLVGADGVYSQVAKQFRLNRRPLLYVANEIELEAEPAAQTAWQGRLLVDLSLWPLGYGWVFPKRHHLSVGVGLPKQCARQAKPLVDRLRRWLSLEAGQVIRQRSHMLPFRRPGQPVVRGPALVVGDAAGLVDPNTGAGIGWAIRSGILAGETIGSFLRREVDSLRGYQQAIERAFGQEIVLARVMRNLLMLRFALFGHRTAGDRQLWQEIFAIVQGNRTYAEWYAGSPLAKALRWTTLIPL